MRRKDTATPKSPQRIASPQGVCEQCGVTFIPKRQTKGRFCSPDCYRTWWRANGQREYSKRGLARLEQLRSEGRDPRSSEQAAWKRKMAFRSTALTFVEALSNSDDQAWAERGAYWQQLADPPQRLYLTRRPGQPRPLVLAGHGVRLRVEHGTLVVRHGFTHHPQDAKEQRFFPGDPRLPSRIVLLDSDGYLTLSVISWLHAQQVPLVVLDWRGRIVSVLGVATEGADPELRDAQLTAQRTPAGLKLGTWLISEKLRASAETLRTLLPSRRVDSALERLTRLVSWLDEDPPEKVDQIRLLEARGAVVYFRAWQGLGLRWKGTARRPIPPEWRRMALRQSLLGGRNRNATHPVSAIQNYVYATVESQIRVATAAHGLDPNLGFLHVSRRGREAFVYDLMEPLRPVADRMVLDLIRSQAFSAGDFFIGTNGVCRLHPQLARVLANSSVPLDAVDTIMQVTKAGLLAPSE
jgi:CRISPR-associated protein Cas1